jgi:alpha-beta hydrolase superfamily lysophospholipase
VLATVLAMASTVERITTASGHERFQRHWEAAQPRASLLLVHGIAEHSGRYEHVGEAFAADGIDTLSFDLRGHGESGGRRGHVDSFDDFLDDVADLLDDRRDLGVPVVLMGHSLGGLIAATAVVRGRAEPDLLILSAPALDAKVPGWQRALAAMTGRIAPTFTIKNDFDGSRLSRDDAVGVAYRDDPLRTRVSSARLGSSVFAAMVSTSSALDRITMPTYVLHGSDDRLVPVAATDGFEQLPNATRVVHDGLRHECLNEPEQAEVIAGILDWLDQQLAARTG